MSGQPNRNPTDPAKFRQQYLANLALDIGKIKFDEYF